MTWMSEFALGEVARRAGCHKAFESGDLPTMQHQASRNAMITLRAWIPKSLFLTSLGTCLVSCSQGVLNPQGPIGKAELVILTNATAIMLAIVIPVILLTVSFAWWFRAGNERARHMPDWEYSGAIEVIVWSIPALVILFLGGIAWIGSHELHPPKPIASVTPGIEVEVVSLDWKWLFIYPQEGIASVNRLVVPIGTPIHFRLMSASVMNSFFVPQLGSQIYTMPGMTTELNLQADTAGTYKGLSSQFSGEGFSDMDFEVVAIPADRYAAWIDTARTEGNELDPAELAVLARPGIVDSPSTYSPVTSRLFEAVSSNLGVTDLPAHMEH